MACTLCDRLTLSLCLLLLFFCLALRLVGS